MYFCPPSSVFRHLSFYQLTTLNYQLTQKLIIPLILILSLAAQAQDPALYFERITVENGLSNNKVNCIVQDSRGFIWMGTNDGLNRYDGHNFTRFRNRPGDSASIGGNLITEILEDDRQVLWIASADGGLTRYDYRLPASRQFKQYKHLPGNPASLPTNTINALTQDNQGHLWLGTSGHGLFRFNKQSGQFDKNIVAGPKTVLDLCTDKNGIIWAGRQGGGILKINPNNFATERDPRYDNLYAQLPHMVVTSLFCDRNNNMWYGSWDKLLYQFNAAEGREITLGNTGSGFVKDEVTSFAQDPAGRIWIGGKTGGLQILDPATGQCLQYRNNPLQEGSITDNHINCIYIDRKGMAWLGTDKGISTASPVQQQFVQRFLQVGPGKNGPGKIYDFYKDPRSGDLWMGTDKGLFIRKNNGSLRHLPLSYQGNPLAVTKIYRSNRGQFYLGTNYSLFLYNPAGGAITLLPNTQKDAVMNHIISSRIVSITEDKIDGDSVLIVSPYGHYIAYYNFRRQQWVSRLDSVKKIIPEFNLKDYLIHKLYHNSSGTLWVANAQEGLGEWHPSEGGKMSFSKNNPALPDALSNNHVYDIAEDARQNLWISTFGGGLNHYNLQNKTFSHIPASNNLLEGIAPDSLGRVWMVSNGQLQRYDPNTGSGAAFSLPDREKSGGVSGYIYTDQEGILYLAGKNYYIAFRPGEIEDRVSRPEIWFTDFRIFNQPYGNLLSENTIHLSYRQNYFTIEFAAPDYESQQPVQYAYMLEGFDKVWVECGTRNFAPYANLEGGTYTFRIRASNRPGIWEERKEKLTIVITPPVWKRWWFYLLAGLLIAAIIYALYRYRINELLKRQAIRNRIAQDLHDNMGSTLSSIAVYSQVAQIQSNSGAKEELNEVLGKISATSNDMIAEMNDIVWAINPRNDSMEKIIQRMESFARPLLAARNIQFGFQYNVAELPANLDMQKRKNFYLIFREAITNVIRYSGASQLDVSIRNKQHRLLLEVNDNGVGFDPAREMGGNTGSLSGNGLRNMQMRATEMKGQLLIQSEPGRGTKILLDCPIP